MVYFIVESKMSDHTDTEYESDFEFLQSEEDAETGKDKDTIKVSTACQMRRDKV